MSFQILDKEGQAIGLNELDKQVAQFWHPDDPSTDPKYYQCPKGSGANWFDTIGYQIHNPVTNYTSGWDNVKCSIWTIQLRAEYKHWNMPETLSANIADNIKWLTPFFELIDHWESLGYQPHQVKD